METEQFEFSEDPSISVPDGETVIKVKKVYLTSKTKHKKVEVDD